MPRSSGLLHSNRISWYAFSELIISQAGKLGIPIKAKHIHTCTSSEYPTAAKRPKYSILNCNKIASDLNYSIPDVQAGLLKTLHQLKEQYEK